MWRTHHVTATVVMGTPLRKGGGRGVREVHVGKEGAAGARGGGEPSRLERSEGVRGSGRGDDFPPGSFEDFSIFAFRKN